MPSSNGAKAITIDDEIAVLRYYFFGILFSRPVKELDADKSIKSFNHRLHDENENDRHISSFEDTKKNIAENNSTLVVFITSPTIHDRQVGGQILGRDDIKGRFEDISYILWILNLDDSKNINCTFVRIQLSKSYFAIAYSHTKARASRYEFRIFVYLISQ